MRLFTTNLSHPPKALLPSIPLQKIMPGSPSAKGPRFLLLSILNRDTWESFAAARFRRLCVSSHGAGGSWPLPGVPLPATIAETAVNS